MTLDDYQPLADAITERCHEDGDACLLVYFSREDDQYRGCNPGMDAGDALLVIRQLMAEFDLDPEAVAAME